MQEKMMYFVKRILVTPYNLSLISISLLLWWLMIGGFWNNNFDMLSSVSNYVMLTSSFGMALGLWQDKSLAQLSILSELLTVITLILHKSVITSWLGIYFIPIMLFSFLLVLQRSWLLTQKSCN